MSFQIMILGPLNSGGYGDLYIGQRSDTGERLAVKYLREFQNIRARKEFARQIGILRRGLKGVIPVLFSDPSAERPWYAMPYLEGGTVTRYAGRLTPLQLQNVALELAIILANFHNTIGTHGDFKPDNVLVSQDGRLNVADPSGNGFGCTMIFSQNPGGTPGYWAPEVGTTGVTKAGDVYSYAATVRELLTGQRPLKGQRLDQSLEQYVCPAAIREVIAACSNLNPDARPTMSEVVRILRGESWAQIWAQRQQIRQALALATALGVLLVAGRALQK